MTGHKVAATLAFLSTIFLCSEGIAEEAAAPFKMTLTPVASPVSVGSSIELDLVLHNTSNAPHRFIDISPQMLSNGDPFLSFIIRIIRPDKRVFFVFPGRSKSLPTTLEDLAFATLAPGGQTSRRFRFIAPFRGDCYWSVLSEREWKRFRRLGHYEVHSDVVLACFNRPGTYLLEAKLTTTTSSSERLPPDVWTGTLTSQTTLQIAE